MQSKDTDVECAMWWKINKVMVKNGVAHLNFKGFMAENAQANWNIMCIVYNFDDPSEPMIDKERT